MMRIPIQLKCSIKSISFTDHNTIKDPIDSEEYPPIVEDKKIEMELVTNGGQLIPFFLAQKEFTEAFQQGKSVYVTIVTLD